MNVRFQASLNYARFGCNTAAPKQEKPLSAEEVRQAEVQRQMQISLQLARADAAKGVGGKIK